MAFMICKKCKAGCSTSLDDATKEAVGFVVGGLHRPGECDGEIEVVRDQQAGAGPGYVPPTGTVN